MPASDRIHQYFVLGVLAALIAGSALARPALAPAAEAVGATTAAPRAERTLAREARRLERRAAFFAEIDANGDGVIDAEEIAAWRAARFAAVDADGDGLITPAELEAFRQVEAARRAFAALDANGDGAIDAEEWAARTERMIDRLDGPRADAASPHPHRKGDGSGRGDRGPRAR